MTQLTLSLQGEPWPISRPRIRRLVLASLDATTQTAVLTLRLVNQREGLALNREFRGQDHATNVLTFPYSTPPALEADLVLCLPVIQREARQQKKSVEHHLMHLIVHGCLHACGLDHEDEREAEAMEALEGQILKRFRISNPYGNIESP
jgi:probable rRNA maturation factor